MGRGGKSVSNVSHVSNVSKVSSGAFCPLPSYSKSGADLTSSMPMSMPMPMPVRFRVVASGYPFCPPPCLQSAERANHPLCPCPCECPFASGLFIFIYFKDGGRLTIPLCPCPCQSPCALGWWQPCPVCCPAYRAGKATTPCARARAKARAL